MSWLKKLPWPSGQLTRSIPVNKYFLIHSGVIPILEESDPHGCFPCGPLLHMPGAQMMVVMAESFIPPAALDWFGVVRQSVVDRRDTCVEDYVCDFSQD